MTAINFPYIDSELENMAAGKEPPGYWRALHWGLFSGPDADDDPERYVEAGEALTERIVSAGEVADGRRILDVGCGFGGTVDHVAARNSGCSVVGLNIDERQLRQARVLLDGYGRAADSSNPFVTADACTLPVADGVLDHVLAVECIFHFPSRKRFFKEAARVLKPGGTLALSDFVIPPGAIGDVLTNVDSLTFGPWFGYSAKSLTSVGYQRMGRAVGLDVIVDDDVNDRTLPTYAALRRIYKDAGMADGLVSIDACEELARTGRWRYHILAFRKRGG